MLPYCCLRSCYLLAYALLCFVVFRVVCVLIDPLCLHSYYFCLASILLAGLRVRIAFLLAYCLFACLLAYLIAAALLFPLSPFTFLLSSKLFSHSSCCPFLSFSLALLSFLLLFLALPPFFLLSHAPLSFSYSCSLSLPPFHLFSFLLSLPIVFSLFHSFSLNVLCNTRW